MRRNPTVADVADHADVSTATVSRYLNSSPLVSPALAERIQASIVELGYVLDGAARALRTQRSRTIGVIVPTLDIGSFAAGVEALQETLFEAGHAPILAVSNYDPELELRHAHNLVRNGVDGLVFIGFDKEHGLAEFLEERRIPFVRTWTVDPESRLPCVGFDNRQAMKKITRYVLDKGHRKLAMIVGGHNHKSERTLLRRQGFLDAFSDSALPLPINVIREVDYGIAGGRLAFDEIWSQSEKPTAIVCGSDLLAIGVLLECLRRGIRVPDELSVTGYDDLEIAGNFCPALTTMHVPSRAMGDLAARYLLDVLNGRPANPHVVLASELIERETVAPVAVA